MQETKMRSSQQFLPSKWRRITANLMLRPPAQQNTKVVTNTAAATAAQTNLMFNGTVRVIAFDGELPPAGGPLVKTASKTEVKK